MLRSSRRTVQVFARVCFSRMHLHRELFGGVQQFNQHCRVDPVTADMFLPEQFDRMFLQIFGETDQCIPQPDLADPVSG